MGLKRMLLIASLLTHDVSIGIGLANAIVYFACISGLGFLTLPFLWVDSALKYDAKVSFVLLFCCVRLYCISSFSWSQRSSISKKHINFPLALSMPMFLAR